MLGAAAALGLMAFVLAAGAPGTALDPARAEVYWQSPPDAPTYRDNWSSRYYRRIYDRNVGCDNNNIESYMLGVKFKRISDDADLYRYFNREN